MAKRKATPEQEPGQSGRQRPPGRVRAAWRVLCGAASTPEQIEWEWLEYKERFNDLFVKFNAALARQAKQFDTPEQREAPAQASSKSALRSQVARARGLPSVGQLALVPDPDEENP